MMKSELILVGGGGHCKSCIDVIERQGKYRIAGIIRPRFKRNGKRKLQAVSDEIQKRCELAE